MTKPHVAGAIVVTRQGEREGVQKRGGRKGGSFGVGRLVVLLFLLSSGLLGILLKNLRCGPSGEWGMMFFYR